MTMTDAIIDAPLPDWPMFGLADDMRPQLAAALEAGEPCALVTLYAVVGSSPRPPGAQMLVGAERLSGFLSGGCVEADIAAHARASLSDGMPRMLIYGSGSPYPDVRLLCGGRIDILVEPIRPDDPAPRRLVELQRRRRPAIWLSDGQHRACLAEGETGANLTAPLAGALAASTAHAASDCNATAEPFAIARRYGPTLRMVVVGADPTAIALCDLAISMGLETWLIRPKGPDAPPPLQGIIYRRSAAAEALAEIAPDPWTYVAVATHDLEVDEAALAAALPSAAAYVGVLGARHRVPERLAGLKRRGVSDEALARMRAPIGLDLGGAKSPYEIAVAILAEVTALSRKG